MMWHVHDGMGWWMVFAGTWMILFWGIVIGAIAWLVSRFVGPNSGEERNALEIARQRYARGEISREDFQRITEDLRRPG